MSKQTQSLLSSNVTPAASALLQFSHGKVNCSLKSSGFVAHENLDIINMAIRKQTAYM